MNNQLLYLQDPSVLEFDAQVLEIVPLPDNRLGLVLDRSYFYPTGGGQEHDTGTIGPAEVLDIYKDGGLGRVLHVVDREVALGPVSARIDSERRLRHMHHHSAQHLLTACFLKLFDLDTLSANINGYSPSTLDLPAVALDRAALDRVEDLANSVIFEDRPVKIYFATPDEIAGLPLRRRPSVTENIRIVEIDGFDYSPCGGTHVRSTGSIGLIKILKTERPNKEVLRVSYMAGLMALQYLRQLHEVATRLSGQMGVPMRDLPEAMQRQGQQLRAAQAEMEAIQSELLVIEAYRLGETAEHSGPYRLVVAAFTDRPAGQLRVLAGHLREPGDIVAILFSYDGQKLSLVVVCPTGTGINARDLLNRLLSLIGGRGGGDAFIAQGGGPASEEQAHAFAGQARSILHETIQA